HLYQPEAGKHHTFFEASSIGQLDLPRARQGDLAGGLFAIFTPPPPDSPELDPYYGLSFTDTGYSLAPRSPIEQPYAQTYTDAVLDFACHLESESDGAVKIVRTFAGLEACFLQQMFAMVLHLEGAEAIKPDLSNLDHYYQRGVRSLGLVWSRPNAFGHGVPFAFPQSPDTGQGLTDAGSALVRACNDAGIMIDLAHLNENGFFDVAKISTAPLVVTHADVYAICPSTRNLTDREIDAVGASGGVIGINFEAMNTHPESRIDTHVPLTQITRHIEYVANRIGIDHVAFGSDFDGASTPDELKDVTGLPRLISTLQECGYNQDEIEKIAYRNWFRVLQATWKG
ncbi:MAG TPA: dipeptidase, partial [Phototrophicaceae bacterium]|nr:dipeptidase [Phototrophicaceae bacterium]